MYTPPLLHGACTIKPYSKDFPAKVKNNRLTPRGYSSLQVACNY